MVQHKWRLVSLALIGVIGIIAGAVYAASDGDTEVRVSALRHDDGRVEVAVQQRDAEGDWGERIKPDLRFVPTDRTGVWLNSSPVAVQVAAMQESMTEEAMPPVAMPSEDAPAELFCVIHHGADDDTFWTSFNLVALQNASELGLTNVEIRGEPVVADQAAAIDDCVERGALGIASSIPDHAGLKDSLTAARTSGAFLVTFNSGADVAGLVGSTIHYGLDDRGAGELAGREFNEAGATGAVLCVIHEEVNIGLQDRCDGLESTYAGPVERVTLPAGSLSDAEAAGTAMAEAIGAHEAAGVLVLNPTLAHVAIGTVSTLGSETLIGSVGRTEFSLLQVIGGQMLFAIDDGEIPQASHVILALKNVDSSPSARAILEITASQAPETTTMLIRPIVLNQAYIDNLPPGWQQQICALATQIAPDQALSLCDE